MQVGFSWDAGLIRKLNEDSIAAVTFEVRSHEGILSAGLFAVADGMGGHNAGETASDLAVRTFQAQCLSALLTTPSTATPISVIGDAFKLANNTVATAASERALQGMGTTLTAALIIGSDMYIAHIGDSRCYIINDREMLQVTRDHSFVQQLVEYGLISPEQARIHPRRNEITRVLGYMPDADPDLIQVKLYAGDSILLCSDGLHGVVDPDKLALTVNSIQDPNQACVDLIEEANAAGGPDNISVIIIKPGNLPSWQAMISAQTSVRNM